MKKRDRKKPARNLRGGGKLGKVAGELLLSGLCLLGTTNGVLGQNTITLDPINHVSKTSKPTVEVAKDGKAIGEDSENWNFQVTSGIYEEKVSIENNGGNVSIKSSSTLLQGTGGNGGAVHITMDENSAEFQKNFTVESLGGTVTLPGNNSIATGGNGGEVTLNLSGNENYFFDQKSIHLRAYGHEAEGETAIGGNGGSVNMNVSGNGNEIDSFLYLNAQGNHGTGNNATGGDGGTVNLNITGDGNTFTQVWLRAYGGKANGEVAQGGNGGTVNLTVLGSEYTLFEDEVTLSAHGGNAHDNNVTGGNGGNVLLSNQGEGSLSFNGNLKIKAYGGNKTGVAGNVTMDFSGNSNTFFSGDSNSVDLSGAKPTSETGNFVMNIRDEAYVAFDGDTLEVTGARKAEINLSDNGYLYLGTTLDFSNSEDGRLNISGGTLGVSDNTEVLANTYFTGKSQLNGELTIQDKYALDLNGEVVLYYDNSMIDAGDAREIHIGSNAVISLDKFYNAEAVEDTDGRVLLIGNGTDLSRLEGTISTLLYEIHKKVDGDDLIIGSARANNIYDVANQIGGNANALLNTATDNDGKESLAYEFFQEKTVSDAVKNIAEYTMEAFASNATAQVQRLSFMNQQIARMLTSDNWTRDFESSYEGMSHDRHHDGVQLWSTAYGLGGVTREYQGFARHDYDQWGMIIGGDWQNDTTRFGLYYAYGQSDFAGVATTMESDDHTFGAYLRWDSYFGGGYSLLGANYSFSNYDTAYRSSQKVIDMEMGMEHLFQQKLDGSQGSIYFEKGWEWKNCRGGRFNPYVALQYIGFESDGFEITENYDYYKYTYATLGDVEIDSLRSVFGMRWNRMCHFNLASVNFSLGLAWHHEFADTEGCFLLSKGGFDNPVVIRGNGGGRDWCEFTLGTGLALTDRVTLSGDYYLFVNGPTSVNAGSMTLTMEF
ncbi:MAG: autotransporter domain-containing protein [Planctomycetia bacterium]|nr:autotransporter domain-containing protein [Planctomycetia bacterium]